MSSIPPASAHRQAKNAASGLGRLLREISGCRVCVDTPTGQPLPHEPRPVLRVRSSARVGVFGQAPGLRAHDAGLPFKDPSGVRLREWMGVDEQEFYDEDRIAFVPMGFCFPGYNEKGSDLPPRRECARTWRARLIKELPNLELVLLVGSYAQRWHLPEARRQSLTDVVRAWRETYEQSDFPRFIPLPHPSWRNSAWLKANPWFEVDVLPVVRSEVRRLIATASDPVAHDGGR
ncbi:Uracil-DNA glycosylase [Candidatus Filomicrobium marinum]|uniref:Uracil-DNA glycosylase n=2 Tax=Filomicrobium TaxID=119044 RepID=A0A0D6JIX2_9HYPH|nr:Uracil-DNA glycosylase [Candidatus Filomicrobium marinum]CPR21898.1 Uracil-DNA glycosylase [Candidatus Filomicrobium marinum]SDP49489.1 Uracil-DNA glycosylase [Filomicrobium insigne]